MVIPKAILNAVHGKPLGRVLNKGDRFRIRMQGYVANQKRCPSKEDCPYPEGEERGWWIAGWECEGMTEVYAKTPPKDWDGAKGIVPPAELKPVFGLFNVLPECPKCHEQNHDWWDGLTIQVQDGTEWPATCGNCGTDYKVVAMVDTLFATKLDP